MKLRQIAHSRAGDKGRIVNLSLIAFDPRDYERLERTVTVDRVRAQLGALVEPDIARYALPQLGALNFVLTRAGVNDVTRSLALDAHGKSLSFALLNMEIDDDTR